MLPSVSLRPRVLNCFSRFFTTLDSPSYLPRCLIAFMENVRFDTRPENSQGMAHSQKRLLRSQPKLVDISHCKTHQIVLAILIVECNDQSYQQYKE